MRGLTTLGQGLPPFIFLLLLLPLFLPLPLRLLPFLVFFFPASLGLDTGTLLADPRVARRPMVRANPSLSGCDGDPCRRFPSWRIIVYPRVCNVFLFLTASRDTVVACHLGVVPRYVIVFLLLDVMQTGIVPVGSCPWSDGSHCVSCCTSWHVLFFVFVLPIRINRTWSFWSEAWRRCRSTWTAFGRNTCCWTHLHAFLFRFEATSNVATPVGAFITAELRGRLRAKRARGSCGSGRWGSCGAGRAQS